MHTPTLLILATLLMGLMSGVLLAVSHFNRAVPGLRTWAWSYVCGLVVAVQLLLRGRVPEVPSVVLTQACMFWMAYGGLLAARSYMGSPGGRAGFCRPARRPWPAWACGSVWWRPIWVCAPQSAVWWAAFVTRPAPG